MEKPNYTLIAKEVSEVPYKTRKTEVNQKVWRIITGITIFTLAYDLLYLQGIYGSFLWIFAIFTRYTFPKSWKWKRVAIWFFYSLVLCFSQLVEEYEFVWYLLIAGYLLFQRTPFSCKLEKVLFPVEIQFYDDHLIIYREKHHVFSWKMGYFQRQYNKIFYEDVERSKFGRFRKGFLNFYGKVETIRYKYDDDGKIIEPPFLRETKYEGVAFINTKDSPEIDFVAEVEKHSPIRIIRDGKYAK